MNEDEDTSYIGVDIHPLLKPHQAEYDAACERGDLAECRRLAELVGLTWEDSPRQSAGTDSSGAGR